MTLRSLPRLPSRCGGSTTASRTAARTALESIRLLEVFFREIGLPVTLKELGVRDDRFSEMARKCTERGPVGNFVRLGRDEVLEVYKLAV